MTTRITVTTGDGGLLERNAQQQAANRQGTLVKRQAEQAAALGDSQLRAERIAQGRNPTTGLPLPSAGSTSRLTRIDQEPAAFRSLVQADFYVIGYNFNTGRDLDTRTQLVYTNNSLSNTIGWCKDETIDINSVPVVIWGGDNTGIGLESVLVDRVAYTEQTGSKTIKLKLNAFWYRTFGDSVNIEVTGYKGGQMVKSGFTWVNPTAIKVWENFSTLLSYSVITNISDCIDGDFVTYLTIDYIRGKITYSQVL